MADINEMENIQQINETVNNDGVNETTETAEQKKKFGVGEYAVLASAIVGAATMAVASFKFVKNQVRAGRNFLKRKREEMAKEDAKDGEIKDDHTEEKPETNKKDKKD